MNFFKRALKSVTRKKGKSLILFAVIFILGNVIAGAIAVQQSTQNVEKKTKQELGGMATIEIDFEKHQDELMKEDTVIENLSKELIDKVGKSSYVKYYDYSASGYIETKKVKSVSIESEESVEYNEFGLSIKGVNYPKVMDIEEKVINLTEGKVFTQEDVDKGSNKVLISEKLAEVNGWSVGDQVVLDGIGYEYSDNGERKEIFKQDIPIEIIGLYTLVTLEKKSEDGQDKSQSMNDEYMNMYQLNTIYMVNKTAIEISNEYMEKFIEKASDPSMYEQEEEQGPYYMPYYVLNSPDDVDAFKQDVEPLLPPLYAVKTSVDQYEQIGGSMKKMSQISGYVVWIAVFATLLIISLVVLLFMRDRKHELGIYLSLGDKRSHVMGQIIIEMLLISGVALILSLLTGNLLGKAVSESLLSSDLLASSNTGNEMLYFGPGLSTDLTSADILDAYQVTFSAGYIITYIVVGLGTVLLSAILPLLYIVRLNPKKIML